MEEIKLSKADKKVLAFAVRAGQAERNRLTIEEVAKNTGTTTDFIYKRLSDDQFRGLFLESLKISLAAEVPAILERFAKEAKSGSFKHGKLLLEIAGLHSDETRVKLDATIQGEVLFKSEEEKEGFLRSTLRKYTGQGGQ